jgi:hypothetical protein
MTKVKDGKFKKYTQMKLLNVIAILLTLKPSNIPRNTLGSSESSSPDRRQKQNQV